MTAPPDNSLHDLQANKMDPGLGYIIFIIPDEYSVPIFSTLIRNHAI
jgi:hypothetical protein